MKGKIDTEKRTKMFIVVGCKLAPITLYQLVKEFYLYCNVSCHNLEYRVRKNFNKKFLTVPYI